MHQNYYFLKQISAALEERLRSAVISECFSQSREELLIRFETHGKPFFIRASLLSEFSTISFPDDFQRARKNSVDLLPELIGQRVQNIYQFANERSFAINLSNNFQLIFKMHGNRSNVVLLEQGVVIALFKKNIKGDHAVDATNLDRHIDWTFEAFSQHQSNLRQLYFTFGKHVWDYLEASGFFERTIEQRWETIQALRSQLDSGEYYLQYEGKPALTLFPPLAQPAKKFTDAFKAANEFYYAFTQVYVLEKERNNAVGKLNALLSSSHNYIVKTSQKLQEIRSENDYKVCGDLIMANLHRITPGMESVTVENFYNSNEPIDLRLKKDLTPQKNAEILYRKSKNQQIEIDHLQKSIEEKRQRITGIETLVHDIVNATDLRALRFLVSSNPLFSLKEKESQVLPYYEFDYKNFRILVGKNAESNDLLLQKFGYKEDLWLHAKDVAGSHVLIKYQSGKNFPKDVIERAAQLAAYNSKRKNDTLCPVIVTPKKFVRKRKGDPPGAVVVEREDVIMVEPRL